MNRKTLPETHSETHKGTLASYIMGFLYSIALSVVAFLFVESHVSSAHESFSHGTLTFIVLGLAMTQLVVQLVFFLHLDKESKPRWNLLAFLFMLMVLAIVVLGSLWIMHNLDYHMMSPSELKTHMHAEEGL